MNRPHLSPIFPLVALLVFLPWAAAQRQGNQGGGTGTGNTGNTPAKIPRMPSPTAPESPWPGQQTVPETIFLTGTVIQEDGTPAPFGTTIELDCGDTITREATVDSTGHYGFQVGSNNRIGRVMADASDPIGLDPFDTTAASRSTSAYGALSSTGRTSLSTRLLRCELRAQSPGYRSNSVRMVSGKISGYTEVANILMYRIEKIQGTSVSVSSMMAPKDARKSVERATNALRKNKLGEAEELLRSSLETYPKNAEAWFFLGQVQLLQRRNEDARASYEKAIEVDSFYVRPYIPLARLELVAKNWQNSADLTDKALALDPISFPEAYLLNSFAHYSLGEMDSAEQRARKGQRLDFMGQYPQMHLILANILARKKDDPGSLTEMRLYLKAAPKAKDADLVRSRIEEKEKLLRAANKP